MKRIVTLITTSLLITGYAYAQDPATPNAGFENWTQVGSRYDPNDWSNLNPSTYILGVYTCTRASGVDKHSGNYAIKLQTKSVFFQTANGVATTGKLLTTAPYGVNGGLPFTNRPDSISGWFKYTPAGTDSGFVQFALYAAGDTVGFVRFETGQYATTTYTRFSAPVVYLSAATPDTALWLLSSSRAANPVINSTLYLDDLELIYNPTCNAPEAMNNTNITATSFKANWDTIANAIKYKVRYREKGTTAWTTLSNTKTNKIITGLTANTKYQWQVRSQCAKAPNVFSSWSISKFCTTLVARESLAPNDASAKINLLTIYPNPAHDIIALSFETSGDALATLTITNQLGQTVITKSINVADGFYNDNLDVSAFTKGIYSIRIQTPTESSIQKLLIN